MKRSLLLGVAASVGLACATPDPNATVSPGELDRDGFAPVSAMLQRRCGSLDCHGSRYRNFRLYGYGGLRLSGSDSPEAPKTTPAEIGASYDALMGLEPEVMRKFIGEGRHDPGMLTLYRKARMTEAHEGGTRLLAGDAADRCLVSWLRATTDVGACAAAANERNPLDE